jgi:5-methylcytosine-specific restriction endonuclease McrA
MFKSGRGVRTLKATKSRIPRAPRAPTASFARDGFLSEGKDFYKSPEWQKLKEATKARDGGKCRRCGARVNLHVHHIRSRFKQGADNLANTITLCLSCHQDEHSSHNIRGRKP